MLDMEIETLLTCVRITNMWNRLLTSSPPIRTVRKSSMAYSALFPTRMTAAPFSLGWMRNAILQSWVFKTPRISRRAYGSGRKNDHGGHFPGQSTSAKSMPLR